MNLLHSRGRPNSNQTTFSMLSSLDPLRVEEKMPPLIQKTKQNNKYLVEGIPLTKEMVTLFGHHFSL